MDEDEVPGVDFTAEVASQDLSRYQLDARDVLMVIRAHLSGYTYDPETGKWVHNPEDAMLNERGVNAVLKLVSSLMHKVVFLSNLSKEKIERLASEIHRQTAKMLFEKYEEFEVRDPRYIPVISLLVGTNVYAALMRAEGGRTAEQIKEVQHTIERIVSKSGGKGLIPWGGGED